MPFSIVRNDITKVKADAIVNTANDDVAIGSGVDYAIYTAAGKDELLAARSKIGKMSPGQAAATPAFNLDAKIIIHVSGLYYNGGENGEADVLRACYDNALRVAKENECGSVAFPLLATGNYGFPKELGLQIAIDSFTEFLKENDMEIILVVFGSDAVSISGKLADSVKSFVDDEYVEDRLKAEYAEELSGLSAAGRGGRRERRRLFGKAPAASMPDEEMPFEAMSAKAMLPESMLEESAAYCEEPAPVGKSLEEELKSIYTDSFEKHLIKLINKKGLKNSEIYTAANMSRQYFSKILNGQVKPSKEKMLALAVGLRLNMDEATDFMRIAGYAFSPISQTDKVVEYFIVQEIYSVIKIDIVLFDYGLAPLMASEK